MLDEGLITADVARERTTGLDREALAMPRVVTRDGVASVPLAHAITASSGVAIGEIALDRSTRGHSPRRGRANRAGAA